MHDKTATREGQMELNEKVAKLCGWKPIENYGRHRLTTMQATIWTRGGLDEDADIRYSLPDYCNDLNDCHEFEKGLSEFQFDEYLTKLWHIVRDGTDLGEVVGQFELVHATAEQRCRAFIATVEASSDPSGNVSDGATGVSAKPRNAVGEQEEDLGERGAV